MMNYTAELNPEMDEEHAKVGIRTIQTTGLKGFLQVNG